MRFHRLKLRNLNALYGEHSIDFERDVMGAPLFLIVGPTGAGKSTLLDAICLALFGQTPRLERRVGKSDTDVEHVMSIGTHECLAELDFSMVGADGTREVYRAVWTMRRAHDDPKGTPQRPERSLHRMRQGALELLVSDHRQKNFEPIFNKALRSLSVEDFKRSILLAQGDFAAFLRAGEGEKASILERVTSTDLYQRIGQKAAERRREADAKWKEVEQKSAGIQVLGKDAREELERLLEAKSQEVTEGAASAKKAQELLEVIRRRERLEKERVEAQEVLKTLGLELEGFGPDRARLDLDARLREPALALKAVDDVLAEQESVRAEIERVALEWEDVAQLASESERERRTAHHECVELEAAWKVAEPKIRAAEVLAGEIEAESKKRQQLHAEVLEIAADLTKCQADLDNRLQEEDARKAATMTLETALIEGRLEEFRSIEAQWSAAIEPLLVEHELRKSTVLKLDKEVLSVEAELAALEARKNEQDLELEPATKKVQKARDRLLGLIQPHKDAEAGREAMEQAVRLLNLRISALREATTHHEHLREATRRQGELRDEVDSIQRELAKVQERLLTDRDHLKTLNELNTSLEKSLRKSEQMLALTDLRDELELGTPCPLCGSPVHPFCMSDELEELNSRVRTEAEENRTELEGVKARLADASKREQTLAQTHASKRTSLVHVESQLMGVTEDVEKHTRGFLDAIQRAGFSPLEEYRLRSSEVLEEEIRVLTEELDERSRSYLQVKKAIQSLADCERAKASLVDVEMAEALREKRAAVLRVKQSQESAKMEFERTQVELQKRVEPLRKFAQLVIERETDLDELKGFLQEHRERLDRLNAELKELKEEAGIELRAKEMTRLRDRILTMSTLKEERTREVEKLLVSLNEKSEKLAELVGDRAPAMIRSESEAALKAAAERLKGVQERQNRVRTREGEVIGSAAGLRDRWRSLGALLQERRDTLKRVLEEENLREEEIRDGILEPSVRQALEARARSLDTRIANANERARVNEENLSELKDASGLDEPVEVVQSRLSLVERAVHEATLEAGRLQERIEADDRARRILREAESGQAQIKAELELWSKVGGLIGVSEGGSFREFAQTLNLQGLVQRANRQLEQLHPRYHLVVAEKDGLPTLQFEIVDRYQGDTRRPLTTLSGGESFLVSLALALALAEFRRLDFPVEILLLDEGFGTLDQESLRMAVATLHKLEARSAKQVAIISHVEALKEMVPVQIRVEPEGFGRSTLRVVH